ncbi:MAG: hypothetical protein ACKO40_10105 [Planctomycetaceae bacterium]
MVMVMGAGHAAAQPLPAAYDLRAVGSGTSTVAWVPAIQDQGQFGDCWTFASATAMDSSLLKQGILAAAATPPGPVVWSWALSTANGAPESLIGPDSAFGTRAVTMFDQGAPATPTTR